MVVGVGMRDHDHLHPMQHRVDGGGVQAKKLVERALAAVQQHGLVSTQLEEGGTHVAVLARHGGTRAQKHDFSGNAGFRGVLERILDLLFDCLFFGSQFRNDAL